MKYYCKGLLLIAVLLCLTATSNAQEKESRRFKIFQFPPDLIPRIDGDKSDWSIMPDSLAIGIDQLVEDNHRFTTSDPKNLDVKVKVAWVKGMNRLYFLYEAYDNYWDFSLPGLHNDIFEVVVDADRSGGPLIDELHPNPDKNRWEAYFDFHGVHAQNYHIFTPAEGKDWTMVWGNQPWIKDLPFANAAYDYNFKPGDSGRLVLEFWITPFDYAGNEPSRAIESSLYENKIISMSWAVIDYDDVNDNKKQGFWNLSREHKMYGNASYHLPFTLLPLDARFTKLIDAKWSFKLVDMRRRLVAFNDESTGKITSWKWDFGDKTTSDEQHPVHQYKAPGKYLVTLWIEGPDGKSRWSRLWDVAVK